MQIDQIELPELRVAALRRVGPYGPAVGETFARIIGWACRNQVFNGTSLVIGAYLDCPLATPPEKCRMDACVTLSPDQNPPLEEGIVIQTLPARLCATGLCSIYNNDFGGAWEKMLNGLKEKQAETDGPCYEFYYGPCAETHPMKKWVVDLVIPLKKRF